MIILINVSIKQTVGALKEILGEEAINGIEDGAKLSPGIFCIIKRYAHSIIYNSISRIIIRRWVQPLSN